MILEFFNCQIKTVVGGTWVQQYDSIAIPTDVVRPHSTVTIEQGNQPPRHFRIVTGTHIHRRTGSIEPSDKMTLYCKELAENEAEPPTNVGA